MRKVSIKLLFGLCLLIASRFLSAQTPAIAASAWQEAGLPYIQNFNLAEYQGNPQNWAITQDDQGVMYFGNGHGLFIFDGVSWSSISTPNRTVVRALCNAGGKIYIGAQDELGYLASTGNGKLTYTSLIEQIPPDKRKFQDVWQVAAVYDMIYFRTANYIFRWANGRMQTWESNNRFHTIFAINNVFYVRQWETGLMRMQGDSLVLLPGGELFANERIYAMMAYDDKRLLLSTRTQGLFIFDGAHFKPFRTEADEFLLENQTYHGGVLPGDLFAFATLRGGVAIIDKTGYLCQIIDEAMGLRDQSVKYLFVDKQSGLWLALNDGIARVETPGPVSYFSKASGVNSIVESVIRHKSRLYLAAHVGIYYLDENELSLNRFKLVPGISTQTWSFSKVGEHLLVGSNQGIHEINGTHASLVTDENTNVTALYKSIYDTNLVYIGHLNGLASIRLHAGRWQKINPIEGVNSAVTSIAEEGPGVLWLGSVFNGVMRVDLNSAPGEANIQHFTKEHGLPDMRIVAGNIDGQIHFATNEGLRRFDVSRQMFVPDSTFGDVFADTSCWIFRMHEDTDKNVWLIGNNRRLDKKLVGCALRQPDGSYQWQGTPLLRANNIGLLFNIYPEENGIVWLAGSEGVARLDPAIPYNYEEPFTALIRSVKDVASGAGYFFTNFLVKQPEARLAHKNNHLRFAFAAPSYDDAKANQFQFILDGYDQQWSNWTNETKKDYTGLPAGSYTFRVKAKNIYDRESREGSFVFQILPPWYQKWWAYLIYILAVAGFITLVVKVRVNQLEKKTQQLEAVVAERTAQLVQQNNKIAEQADKLKELDRMKSRFFANISHEFRTPLTLILGPLEDLIAKTKEKAQKEELKLIRRNANRVLQLINQLLDLAKLESGKLKLAAAPGDFISFLQGLVLSFDSLARQKQISLQFEPAEGVKSSQGFPEVYFDRDKMEMIIYNLLSNAIKFTPEGGEVSVQVISQTPPFDPPSRGEFLKSPFQGGFRGMSQSHSDEYALFETVQSRFRAEGVRNGAHLRISVKDTGIGIPADRLPYIFDRFYQVENKSTREHQGTGIGLALVKELVELHHGKITVASEEGKGAEFVFYLPIGRAHLSDDEIVVSPDVEQTYLHKTGLVEMPEQSLQTPLKEIAGKTEKEIILVVEDNPEVRNFMCKNLESEYRLIEAENGKQGIEIAMDVIPDLIISDVMMPGVDGFELCEALKTNDKTSHIPIILLTAKAGEESRLAGLETGADDYLTKPFNTRELLARVKNLVALRARLRERFRKEGLLLPRETEVTSYEEAFIRKMMNSIEANLDREDFGVESLSLELNIGRRQLNRKLSAITGQTPSDFIRSHRLQRAKTLLEQNAGTVSEIAYQVGFNNLSYFAKCFREEFGVLPSEVGKA